MNRTASSDKPPSALYGPIRVLALLLPLFAATFSLAAETGGCHCFRNRAFNPDEPFASDSYLMTTVFNSLTASHFSIPKRDIVMLKMRGGVQGEDLLIALHLAQDSDMEAREVLAARKETSWQQFLLSWKPGGGTEDELASRITAGLPADEAAGEIAGRILLARFNVDSETLHRLRQRDLDIREIAVILTLAEKVGTGPDVIAVPYLNGRLSLSAVANNLGMQPEEVGRLAGRTPG
jgi:hypothetical protein